MSGLPDRRRNALPLWEPNVDCFTEAGFDFADLEAFDGLDAYGRVVAGSSWCQVSPTDCPQPDTDGDREDGQPDQGRQDPVGGVKGSQVDERLR